MVGYVVADVFKKCPSSLEANGSAAVKVEGLDNPDVQEAVVRGGCGPRG